METWVSYAFMQKFDRLHVRNFQNKILCLLRVSCIYVFDSLRLNKWCKIKISRGMVYCVCFANVSVFFTSVHTHVYFLGKSIFCDWDCFKQHQAILRTFTCSWNFFNFFRTLVVFEFSLDDYQLQISTESGPTVQGW